MIWPWLTGGALYGLGAIMYALKIPERFFPKRFDMVGASHQIFHFAVISAALLHMWGSFKEFHKR